MLSSKKTSDLLDQWIQENKDSYISISLNNPLETLEAGLVAPPEYNVRKTLKYQPNPNERAQDLSKIVSDLKSEAAHEIVQEVKYFFNNDLSKIIADYACTPALPYKIQIVNRMSFVTAYRFMTNEEYQKHEDELRREEKESNSFFYCIPLKDGKSYPVSIDPHITGLMRFVIEGIPRIQESFSGDSGYRESLSKKYNLRYDSTIAIARDLASAYPIDKRLSFVWETYQRLKDKTDLRELAIKFYEWRSREIPVSGPDYFLELNFCKTDFRKNNVAVLRGQSCDIISARRANLLEPFENKGEIFTLDLTEKNTIVIGSQKDLAPYLNKPERNIRIFCFEDMNEKQLAFFQVPLRLNPKEIKRGEKMANVLTTPFKKLKADHFTQWSLFAKNAKAKEEKDNQKADLFFKKKQFLKLKEAVRKKQRNRWAMEYLKKYQEEKEREKKRCLIS